MKSVATHPIGLRGQPFPRATVGDLAIFGGKPAFKEKVHVGRPNIGNREALFARINEMLDRKWLTNSGPFALEFERLIADHIGVKHCVATCNGTTALELVIKALDLNGEVIVPSFTFAATVHALYWHGIKPVFCDIDPTSCTIDPNCADRLVTSRTSAILGVHTWGRPCDVEALQRIALGHGIELFFDAAHAFGCSSQGKMIGSGGRAEVFSFHATKFLNSFEGGAIATDDDALAEKLRSIRNFGFVDYDFVERLGINGKMSEVAAAMGITSMESIHDFIEVNRSNQESYAAGLRDVPGITLLGYDEEEKQNYQYVVIEVDEETAGIDRDLLVDILHAENVLVRRYFYPGCHDLEPYRTDFPNSGKDLPHTLNLASRVMCFPNGTSVDDATIERICAMIGYCVDNASAIRFRLANAGDGASDYGEISAKLAVRPATNGRL